MNDIKFRSRAQVAAVGNTADGVVTAEGADACIQSLKAAAELKKKAVRRALVQDYWKNSPDISPIAGSLSVFGLTIDDLTFASLHRTATKLNDVNEAATLDHQMRHLGRRAGKPLLTIAQKSVIGRELGASSAYGASGSPPGSWIAGSPDRACSEPRRSWRTWVTSMSSCSTRPLGGNK